MVAFRVQNAAKVLVVGLNPSLNNVDPTVPFSGTRSGITLKSWMTTLGLPEIRLINVSDRIDYKDPKSMELIRLELRSIGYNKIIALGNEVSKILKKLDKKHFKLPHPSGRNRLLNDPQYIIRQLGKCGRWLNTP